MVESVDNQTISSQIMPNQGGASQTNRDTTKSVIKAVASNSATQNETATIADLTSAVNSLNDFVDSINKRLSFDIDKNSGREVISVYDNETKELIKQIPSEEVLKLIENIKNIRGVLFDTVA